jgi:transmembrane sensor
MRSDEDKAFLRDEVLLRTAAEWWMRLREADDDQDTVTQWLAWSEADKRHLAAFEQISQLAAELSQVDDVTRERLIRKFDVSPTRRWLHWAAAAVIVLGIGLGVYGGWKHYFPEEPWQTYASSVAVNRDVDLADGSHIVLGGASQLQVRLGSTRRSIELNSGEAFFRVAHESDRDFVVRAGKLVIRAVGTMFDVRRTGERIQLAVVEGSVQLTSNGGRLGFAPSAGTTLAVSAGQQVVFDPATAQFSLTHISAQQAMSWQEDRLEFVDEPLSSVIANVNRYSRRPLMLATPDLNGLVFTGTVYTNAIDNWLGALPQVMPVQVESTTKIVVLRKSGNQSK